MKQDREEVEVKGWGLGAKFSGPQVTCVTVLLLLGAGVLYAIYQHNGEMHGSMESVAKSQESVKAELTANRETTEAMLFVLWACRKSDPDKECDRMNLTKPKKLQEMQR